MSFAKVRNSGEGKTDYNMFAEQTDHVTLNSFQGLKYEMLKQVQHDKVAFTLVKVFHPAEQSKKIAPRIIRVVAGVTSRSTSRAGALRATAPYRKFGFTLAEVLITLGIIGVVAALTMPSLISKYDNLARQTALKKAYSVLSQATSMVISEHGTPVSWGIKDDDADSIEQVWQYYKPNLKVVRKCQNQQGYKCFATPAYFLNGEMLYTKESLAVADGEQSFFKTADGMNIVIDISAKEWVLSTIGIDIGNLPETIWFRVDVNGNKGPNMIGRDIFHFVVTHKGLKPGGVDNDSEHCNTNDRGYDCAAKFLKGEKY